jgi:hypothetical protein
LAGWEERRRPLEYLLQEAEASILQVVLLVLQELATEHYSLLPVQHNLKQYNITWNSTRAHEWDGEISVVVVQNLFLGVSNLSVCNLESRPCENPQKEAQIKEKSYRFCVHNHKMIIKLRSFLNPDQPKQKEEFYNA